MKKKPNQQKAHHPGWAGSGRGWRIHRAITGNSWGLRCTRCGLMFEDETEAEDHLNGPTCDEKSKLH